MDRIDAMKVFIAALDEESLAVASRRLKPSPTAVSRALPFLEPHVGGVAAGYVAGQNVENQRGVPLSQPCRTSRHPRTLALPPPKRCPHCQKWICNERREYLPK
jgi:hypothetical protein